MIQFPFIGPSYPVDRVVSQRTVNYYPEHDENYKDKVVLLGFPGDTQWSKLGEGPVRGGVEYKGDLIAVSKNLVYRVNEGGGVTQIGAIGTSSGHVSIDENGSQAMIVDGKDGWIWDGSTLTKITDTTFTSTKADSVTHMDSYFIVNKPDTGEIWVSDAFDGLNWNALRTATAEFKSDPVIGVYADRELFLGGKYTIQGYYNSGASPMPFEAIRSARLIYGVAAKRSWAIVGNTSYFLAQDRNGHVFLGRLNGAAVDRVSTRAWEREWAKYDYADAIGFGVQFEGHEWYVLTFPIADHGWGRTFVYDIATGWITEIGVYRPSVGDFGRHPMTSHHYFSGKNLIGSEDGWLRYLDSDSFTFESHTLISRRTTPVLHDGREKLFPTSFEIDMEVGKSTPTVDPQIMLKISRDGGLTFGNQRTTSISEDTSNKYRTRVRFNQLGSARDFVFQTDISDAVPRKLIAGYVS